MLQDLERTFLDKTDWSEGPWQNEPDEIQWTDPQTGLPCRIKRHPTFGHLCGYVGVLEGHCWFEVDVDDLVPRPLAHGRVNACFSRTENAEGSGEPTRVWWVGFDCGHVDDFCPARDAMLRNASHEIGRDLADMFAEHTTYCDLPYVTRQCTMLAAQACAFQLLAERDKKA